MRNFEAAVESVGDEVYLVKDKKIIGIGRAVSGCGYHVNVHMTDERAQEYLKDHRYVQILGFRWAFFRYECIAGLFVGGNFSDETDEDRRLLEDTRIVTCRLLDYGIAKGFEDVEGYGSKRLYAEDD